MCPPVVVQKQLRRIHMARALYSFLFDVFFAAFFVSFCFGWPIDGGRMELLFIVLVLHFKTNGNGTLEGDTFEWNGQFYICRFCFNASKVNDTTIATHTSHHTNKSSEWERECESNKPMSKYSMEFNIANSMLDDV